MFLIYVIKQRTFVGDLMAVQYTFYRNDCVFAYICITRSKVQLKRIKGCCRAKFLHLKTVISVEKRRNVLFDIAYIVSALYQKLER